LTPMRFRGNDGIMDIRWVIQSAFCGQGVNSPSLVAIIISA
jgi:hypothetical protein